LYAKWTEIVQNNSGNGGGSSAPAPIAPIATTQPAPPAPARPPTWRDNESPHPRNRGSR
jgi:hypothetical protein